MAFSPGAATSARAEWSPAIQLWAAGQARGSEIPFADGGVATFWGAMGANRYLNRLAAPTFLPSAAMERGRLPVILSQRRSRAPLLVYFAGTFEGGNLPRNLRTITRFATRGYHVLFIPQSLSPEYLLARPKFALGDFAAEAEVARGIVRAARAKLGVSRVSRLELVGESYGGVLAAASVALDEEAPPASRALDGARLTLLSPPARMDDAVAGLDAEISRTAPVWASRCAPVRAQARVIKEFVEARSQADLGPLARDCGAALAVRLGFQTRLAISIKLARLPVAAPPRDELRFEAFIADLAPAGAPYAARGSDLGSLAAWLGRARRAGWAADARILTTRDDFLNRADAWSDAEAYPLARDTIVLPWGGHLGYERDPSFERFLDLAFL